MNKYESSICSTCRHRPFCSLTTNMSSIHSCSEYVHQLDLVKDPIVMISAEMADNFGYVGNTVKNEPMAL